MDTLSSLRKSNPQSQRCPDIYSASMDRRARRGPTPQPPFPGPPAPATHRPTRPVPGRRGLPKCPPLNIRGLCIRTQCASPCSGQFFEKTITRNRDRSLAAPRRHAGRARICGARRDCTRYGLVECGRDAPYTGGCGSRSNRVSNQANAAAHLSGSVPHQRTPRRCARRMPALRQDTPWPVRHRDHRLSGRKPDLLVQRHPAVRRPSLRSILPW